MNFLKRITSSTKIVLEADHSAFFFEYDPQKPFLKLTK